MWATSNWMSFHFPGRCFLLYLLAWSSVTRGTEESNEQKCSYKESVRTLIRNTSDYLHDYLGRPVGKDKIFQGVINIFHFKVTNGTKYSNIPSTCCRWNSEGCYIYVWFRSYYYLLISPIYAYNILVHKSSTLPQSICVDIPSKYHKTVMTLTDKTCKRIFIPYQPTWYKGRPYQLTTALMSHSKSRWQAIIKIDVIIIGIMIVSSILIMKAFIKWGRKMITIASSNKNTSKTFTQFKIFGWILSLSLFGMYIGVTVYAIHLLNTHEEYYPEYFLPESVLQLMLVLVMLIIFPCEYPLIYNTINTSRQSRFSYKHGRNHKVANCRDLMSHHLSAVGWAGPIYSVQTFALLIVFITVHFFANPLETFIITMGTLLVIAVSVIVLHELFLMIRHPKECCHCKNHVKILFCVAVVLLYIGLASCLLPLLKQYKDLSPLLDSTKLVQYLISSACIALLGYLGKNKITEILKGSEEGDRASALRQPC